jgi:cbb3-type cytochrome oxidase maturation protein
MEILYILIPISMLLIAIIIFALFWAIKSDQYEDMEGPKHKILMDNDRIPTDKEDNAKH